MAKQKRRTVRWNQFSKYKILKVQAISEKRKQAISSLPPSTYVAYKRRSSSLQQIIRTNVKTSKLLPGLSRN
jgi:hypothetical protein